MGVFVFFCAENKRKKSRIIKTYIGNIMHDISLWAYIFFDTREWLFPFFFLSQHLNIMHSAHLGIPQPRYYLFYVTCIPMHSKLPKLSFISRNSD